MDQSNYQAIHIQPVHPVQPVYVYQQPVHQQLFNPQPNMQVNVIQPNESGLNDEWRAERNQGYNNNPYAINNRFLTPPSDD